jgi:hypothetical protein
MPFGERGIYPPQLSEPDAGRPPIEGDVMDRVQEDVMTRVVPHQCGAHERPGFQIEWPAHFLRRQRAGTALLVGGRQPGQVHNRNEGLLVSAHRLINTLVVLVERGPEQVMPAHDLSQALLKG